MSSQSQLLNGKVYAASYAQGWHEVKMSIINSFQKFIGFTYFLSIRRHHDSGLEASSTFDISWPITIADRQIESSSWGALHLDGFTVSNLVEFGTV